jgi:hypothetical protein
MMLGSTESDVREDKACFIGMTESVTTLGNDVSFPSVCAVACKDAAASNAMSIFFIRNLQFVAKIRKTVQIKCFYSPTLTFWANKT